MEKVKYTEEESISKTVEKERETKQVEKKIKKEKQNKKQSELLKGIIISEIIAKPKALKKYK